MFFVEQWIMAKSATMLIFANHIFESNQASLALIDIFITVGLCFRVTVKAWGIFWGLWFWCKHQVWRVEWR